MVEEQHWFYRGKRDIVTAWLARSGALEPGSRILDCGAGTGRFARGLPRHVRAEVLDDHEESLAYLRGRFPPEAVHAGSCAGIPLPDASVDALTALDVLEHLDDDAGAVAEFGRVVRPGGVLVSTVPAFMSLWSDWDVSLHHRRRYVQSGFRALLSRPPWRLEHLAYINVAAFPAVWLLRRWRGWFPGKAGRRRVEDSLPPAPINAALHGLFTVPAKWRWAPWPFGVGLLAVARRGPDRSASGGQGMESGRAGTSKRASPR